MFTPRRPRDRPIVLAALLCAGLVAARVEAAPPTRVLVLHWFGLDAAFRPAFDAALQEELKVDRDRSVELYSETLEGYRFSPEANEQLMKEYLQRKYAGRPPDVIVAVWDQAVAFLTKYRGELFPGVPIVYTIERTPTGADRAAGMTGLWGSAAVKGTMDLIASLQPNARRLIVVDSIPQTSGSVEVEVRSQFDKLSDRMSLVYIKNQPLPEVLATLKDAPADSVVLFIRQMIRTPTEAMSQLEGLDEVVRATRVPVYGIVEGLVGRGVIGGYVMPSRLTAKAIAGMVLQIAHGTPVRDLPPAKRTAIPVFDWQQLERWHISERSLPTGSVVLNRPPAIWREHPLLAMAVSGVLIGQLTLIAVLVVHRGRRRRAEGLLRRSEARTTALLRMVPDLMFVLSRDGVYLDYHARNPDDLFVKPDQFLGKRIRDIFSPDHARVFEEKFAEALVSDEPVVVEYSLPMPGGERHYETRLLRCDNETIMTIVRDVTLRHQAEEHLHWAQAELQHASRIRALGELAAGIAHEVNQPLAAIITNARTGQRGLDAHPPNAGLVRDVLHDIVADGKRASDVIARVRSMVNQQPLRRTPLEINDVIRDVVAISGRVLRQRQVDVQLSLGPDLPRVPGDRIQLQQVLLNLVLNAADAMRTVNERERTLGIRSFRRDGHVTVSVEDSGSGLSVAAVDRIFTPFFTTKPDGMGVGLSISRSIIEAHGGSLRLSHNSAGGAAFEFDVPVPGS